MALTLLAMADKTQLDTHLEGLQAPTRARQAAADALGLRSGSVAVRAVRLKTPSPSITGV